MASLEDEFREVITLNATLDDREVLTGDLARMLVERLYEWMDGENLTFTPYTTETRHPDNEDAGLQDPSWKTQ